MWRKYYVCACVRAWWILRFKRINNLKCTPTLHQKGVGSRILPEAWSTLHPQKRKGWTIVVFTLLFEGRAYIGLDLVLHHTARGWFKEESITIKSPEKKNKVCRASFTPAPCGGYSQCSNNNKKKKEKKRSKRKKKRNNSRMMQYSKLIQRYWISSTLL